MSEIKIAIFPGSFDPITIGHEDIINRGTELFDKVIVAIGVNSSKKYMHSLDERLEMLRKTFKDNNKVEVDTYKGLTVEYCKDKKANFLLRGLRTTGDFEFEQSIATMNAKLVPEVETIFLMSNPQHSAVSSTIVRDIIRNNGNASQFLPQNIR